MSSDAEAAEALKVSLVGPLGSAHRDAALARRAAAGCGESFAVLAQRHQSGLRHYIRRLGRRAGGSDADDVVQEAFLRAWRRIGEYDSRWAFSTWLFTIARRVWLNHERACHRRWVREKAAAKSSAVGVEPAATAVAVEQVTLIWDIAAVELNEREFTATWLRYAEEKSVAEIAVVLGKPVATVKVILFRARRRLEPFVRDLTARSE
jgi:RNA polymerase sigma-70 factor, ECF subfamily